MGVSHSTARWLAPTSWAVDLAAQLYGMLSDPNMKDVHDATISFFSPQPFFIGGFFFPQQLVQLAWLWRLCSARGDEVDSKAVAGMLDYVPFYTLGNLCIATWMIFWNASNLAASNVFVCINTLAQLYFIARRLPPMDPRSRDSVLTHLVAKTFAGIGVLDMLHNTASAVAVGAAPPVAVKVLTGVGFGLAATCSDWIFGGCLVYDLVALAVGQHVYGQFGWSKVLGAYAGGTAAIVGVKNILRSPYQPGSASGYQNL